MRIALISDIHGNCIALDTVLADITANLFNILSAWAMCFKVARNQLRRCNVYVACTVRS